MSASQAEDKDPNPLGRQPLLAKPGYGYSATFYDDGHCLATPKVNSRQ